MEGITVRVEPGVHGIAFLRKEAQNASKPVRQALAILVANSIKDVQRFRGKKGLVLCAFDDVDQCQAFVAGKHPAELGFVDPLPPGLAEVILRENGPAFFDTGFIMGIALRSSSVAFVARFHLAPQDSAGPSCCHHGNCSHRGQ